MVMAASRDGGRTLAGAGAGPRRRLEDHGGLAQRRQCRAARARPSVAAWYTEGAEGRPDLLFATSADGRRFSAPRRLHTATGSIPDHVRLSVDAAGRGIVVWEDSTAVRRRVVMRTTLDGGRTLSPAQTLTHAVKAFAPDVVPAPGGFLVVWHEEQFPSIKTVIHTVKLQEVR